QRGLPARQRNSSLLVSARQLQAHVRQQPSRWPTVRPTHLAPPPSRHSRLRIDRGTRLRIDNAEPRTPLNLPYQGRPKPRNGGHSDFISRREEQAAPCPP